MKEEQIKILKHIIEKEQWNEDYHKRELQSAQIRLLAAIQMLNELNNQTNNTENENK